MVFLMLLFYSGRMMMRNLILLILMTTIGLVNMANASAHLCDMDAMVQTQASQHNHDMHQQENDLLLQQKSSESMQDHSCCEQPFNHDMMASEINTHDIDHSKCGDCQIEFGSVGACLLMALPLQNTQQVSNDFIFAMPIHCAPLQDTLVVPIA